MINDKQDIPNVKGTLSCSFRCNLSTEQDDCSHLLSPHDFQWKCALRLGKGESTFTGGI